MLIETALSFAPDTPSPRRSPAGSEGAIALYLNIGLMFATLFGLTSTGFGDVTPLHPIVRTLSNVEAIIGQLFSATLLDRLITLELRGYRQRS